MDQIKTSNRKVQALVADIAAAATLAFSDRLIATYIMGSLARGKFSESASDIDIGLLLKDPLLTTDQATIDTLVARSASQHPNVKNAVSVFWGSLDSINGTCDNFQYSPYDRIDLINYGVLIKGSDQRGKLVRPSIRELEVEGARNALRKFTDEERVREFESPELMLARSDIYIAKTILFAARYIYIAREGVTAGHEITSQYYVANYSGDDARLVDLAYNLRLDSDVGLNARSSGEMVKLLNNGLRPLYANFLAIYIQQMKEYEELKLVSLLQNWRDRMEHAAQK
jgi:hypothetical protein